ncbi:hypothetical protein CCHR01_16961 [Colletotrichum chrysophilum]|uniref:Heterokaryon incompatibility domain-containing protein n=1 Tax=Colletotrichum chrysophilum TaxID=1836956 RepID=A0AAD9E7C5_9PEZI|nr:hypothetical protein CCHR01_16961 [Colletotrichum chrysophilum]
MLAVSHVWSPKISAIQQQPSLSPQPPEVRHLAIENPVQVFLSIERDPQFPANSELWHDYISVPQWTDQLKSRILLVIHRIFEEAQTTIIHFDGLTPAVVDKLHHGTTSQERLRGLTAVCNEKWFTRMWTAMEFVRSRSVRMMTGDFQLVEGNTGDDPAFLRTLQEVWQREAKAYDGNVWALEGSVGMRTSENLVPWNLGPLQQCSEIDQFAACAEMTLAQTGPDLNDFVATLGTRLFGEDTNTMIQHINSQGIAKDLENMLMNHYVCRSWRPDWRVDSLGLSGTDAIMWLADALYLNNIVDGFTQSRLGQMFTHAGTVHNKRNSSKIISVTCTYCHKTSLFRAGVYAPANEVRLARAWRIPGLQYQMALKDGMAVLEKDGRILGRMIWATPTCECVEMEMVELRMPDLPNPQPYNSTG